MSDERRAEDAEEEVNLHHDTITERLTRLRARPDEVVDLTKAETELEGREPRASAENTVIEIPEAGE
jgi:F0F1-type ATP synthase membrane subunit b/b'